LKDLRREYDRDVSEVLDSNDLASKRHLASVIDEIYEMGGDFPARIHENRKRLGGQIAAREAKGG